MSESGSLRKHLSDMAAAGCKRAPECGPGDGRCFNCQASDILSAWDRKRERFATESGLKRKDAIIAALKTDVVVAVAQKTSAWELMDVCADQAGGGRAYARYQVEKLTDLVLDMVGALIEAEKRIVDTEQLALRFENELKQKEDYEERCIG